MTREQQQKVDELFDEAVLRPAAQRDAYIQKACDDPVVREGVLARLAYHATQTRTQSITPEPSDHHHEAMIGSHVFHKGDRIGPYTLRKALGGGGFGTVWLAERREPNMTVAIKVLNSGRLDEQSKGRFHAEAQALAILDHECIARIHDSGFSDSGEPFIAMEYVEGEKITAYCDRRSLSLEQRLELVASVCEAIHHAHVRGIIHRDLKPDNILVSEVRRDPKSLKGREALLQVGKEGEQAIVARPKIVDFGLAKALTPNIRLTDMTLTVDLGKLMGTLEYMAPEQTDHNPLSVDTRCDIFALGVVMYELIAGTLPLPKEELRQRAFDEAVARVRGTPRPAPSTRFSSLDGEAAATAARLRGESSPERLARTLRGRLQHLPGTALRLEKEHRYTSAAAFARDIRHYLENEPFEEAVAEPLRRKLWLAMRRRPLPYAAASLLLLSLVAGIIGTTWAWGKAVEARSEADRQRLTAQSNEKRANDAKEEEAKQRKIAETESDRARRSDYVHRIALSDHEIEQGNFETAGTLLAGCPENLRHYEWHRLWTVMHGFVTTLRGHGGTATAVAFSPDGKRVVSGSWDNTIKVWDADRGGDPLFTLSGHKDRISSVAISADGRRIVSGSAYKLAEHLTDDLTKYGSDANEASRIAAGRSVIAMIAARGRPMSRDGTVRVWDAAKGGEALLTLSGHESGVSSVAISADGTRIVSGGADGAIKVWNTDKGGEPLLTLRGHTIWVVSAVALSPDGKRIVSGAIDGTIKVWDAENGGDSLLTLRGHDLWVSSVVFSPDGRRIVSASGDKTIRVWDAHQGGEPLHVLRGHTNGVNSVAISARGEHIVSGDGDGIIKVWDANKAGEALLTLRRDVRALSCVAFSPDGQRIVSGSWDGSVKIFDTGKRGANSITLHEHSHWVLSIAISADGKRIASGSHDKTLRVWNAENGRPLLTVDKFAGSVTAVAFSPDGKRIVSGDNDRVVKLWDMEKRTEIPIFRHNRHNAYIRSVAFSPDGKRFMSGSNDKTIRVWDAEKGGDPLYTLSGHEGGVCSVAFNADSRRIVSGSDDKTIKIWNADQGGEPLFTLRGHEGAVNSVAVSPDGKRIVSGSGDGTIKVWNADQEGDALLTLRRHEGAVKSVAFSPDGRRIVSGGDDGAVKVWDAENGGQALLILRGHRNAVTSVAFSPDGGWIVSGSGDNTIKIWNAGTGDDLSIDPIAPTGTGDRDAITRKP